MTNVFNFRFQGGTFKARQLGTNDCFDILIEKLEFRNFTRTREVAVDQRTYWHASSKTFACVDGFVTGLDLLHIPGSVLGLQYTISEKHGIKHEALKDHLVDFGFVVNSTWSGVDACFNICFVVPPEDFTSMPVQKFISTTGETMKLVSYLEGRIQQFVIMISFENLAWLQKWNGTNLTQSHDWRG